VADAIFQTLTIFFARYGYWAIFFGVMLENAGLPVPGETVLLFAGFLAYQGGIDLGRAILTGIIAAVLGDSMGYCLGRFAGTTFVEKYVRRFKILSGQFDRAQARFQKHGHWAVFVGRFITGLRVFAGPLAGMFRMAYLRFLFFNFSGALIWASTVGCVGFFFGSSWDDLVAFAEKFHQVVLIVLGLAGLVAIFDYLRRRRKKRAS
jgi:membrane protein DedA with SNARE-associated domain